MCDNSLKDGKYFRVGIYLRLSNEDNDKVNQNDDSESIKNQRNMLIDYIDKHPELELVCEYCDEDLSGAGVYRPEFERLIRDCEDGKIDVVLCKSQSRFSRDMEVVERYINNKFKEWNVRFIGLADAADTDNSGNKKSRQINGLVNEWFLEDTSNNIRSAFKSKMQHGEFISPFAAFGYEVSKEDNNKLVIDPIACEIVKEIFDLYLRGFGFTAIAKYLNDRKIPSPSFYKYQKGIKLNIISNRPREQIKWSSSAVKTILTNELYLGHLIQGKRTTVSYKNHKVVNKDKNKWIRCENVHEAIIDEETFVKVQVAIRERTKPVKRTGSVHNFSGKVYCLKCNQYMRKKNSSKHEYLVCSNNRDGYNDCENKTSIRYDVLEKLVLDEINKKIKMFYDEDVLFREASVKLKNKWTEKIKVLNDQRKEIEMRIFRIRGYLRKLYEDRVNGLIDDGVFKELFYEYNGDIEMLNKQVMRNEEEVNYCKKREKSSENIRKLFSKYKQLDKLNKFIIDEFVNKIYVGNIYLDGGMRDIYIRWNFE